MITTVEYRRLVSHGQYENTTIGMTQTVPDDETSQSALDSVKAWVDGQIERVVGVSVKKQEVGDELSQLQWQLSRNKETLFALEDKAKKLRDVLVKHGIKHEDIDHALMPF